MTHATDRRSFLRAGMASLAVPALPFSAFGQATGVPTHFPFQHPTLVREMVLVAHGNLARVKELLAAQPALARASMDWGYGDWECALDAAAHVGHRAIAELLLTHGARPTLFSAAMLGQLEVVRASVAASPGIQRSLGPHSITLMAHAKAGGEQAKNVVDYLQQLGDADVAPGTSAIDQSTRDRCIGSYSYGSGTTERLVVAANRNLLTIQRPGNPYRVLRHLGNHEFLPVGAEAVRVRFSVPGSATRAESVAVYDPGLIVTAVRTGD